MTALLSRIRFAPLFLLAVLAAGTAAETGCSGAIDDDATSEDDLRGGRYGTSYGYGYSAYGR